MEFRMLNRWIILTSVCVLLCANCVEAADVKAIARETVGNTVVQQEKEQVVKLPQQIKGQLKAKADNLKIEQHNKYYEEKKISLNRQDKKELKKELPKGQKVPAFENRSYYNGIMLPRGYKEISIFGDTVCTEAQASAYIKKNASNVKLACSVDELVKLYWKEAAREGIRGDLALCQAITETGFFRYGGDVGHNQNNFCGLGTTGGGVKGAGFATPEIGVRAHIQHLLAYSRKTRPTTKIVDPRYDLAHDIRLERGLVTKWSGLRGTWAMSSDYAEKIFSHYVKMQGGQSVVVQNNSAEKYQNKKKNEGKSAKKRMKKMQGR